MKLDPMTYPVLTRILAAEEQTQLVKNFRHEGRDYSIIMKDPGGLKKKIYIFQVDGQTFSNKGKGWGSPEQALLAIKQYVRNPADQEALAAALDALR